MQERCLEVGIVNPPILSSVISRYLIKNSGLGLGDSERAKRNAAAIASMEQVTILELKKVSY